MSESHAKYGYLPDGHPDLFKDMPLKNPNPKIGLTELCPDCKGHGYRNLRLDAYGKGKHFQQLCWCHGWGYLAPGKCVHKHSKHVAVRGRCYNEYECLDCGKHYFIDSSD